MHIQALTFFVFILFATPSLDESVANAYCEQHRSEWQQVWDRFEVPGELAESIIFPELIRYSLFKDKMETVSVKAMYTRGGRESCNFSIGHFQMKPAFAEDLEKRWMRSGLARQYNMFFDTRDSETARRIRVSRLDDEKWQCIYLAIFLKMLYLDYGSYDKKGARSQAGIETLPMKEQVRLAATAYNSGCRWVNPGYGLLDEIREKSREKKFHLAYIPGPKTRRYVYSDIAVRHWTKIK